jgi:PAS domain S-box-containing protein
MTSVQAAVAIDDRAQLGMALGARAEEAVDRASARLSQYDERRFSDDYEEHRRLRTLFGTLFIARWMVCGRVADEDEHRWLVRGGRLAVAEGVPVGRTTRGYYCWRDSVIAILREEAGRLGTPAAVLDNAIDVTRASCDASLMRMAVDQDHHRETTTQQLAASEARFRTLYETMACGVAVVDPDGSIVQVNEAALGILGISAPELLQANLLRPQTNVHDEKGADVATMFREVAVGLVPVRGRVMELAAAGDRPVRWVQADMVPAVGADGRLAQVVITFIDIRAVKDAERAKAESEAKSRFLATMSHELRTPLNSVLGFAQLLRMRVADRLEDRELRYLDHIELSGRHLLAIINDILDLTKVASGRLEVNVETIEVRPILLGVASDLQVAAETKGLHMSVAPGPALRARADQVRARQVVLNLVSNALKFTPAGEVSVSAAHSGEMIEITVTDTGIGIPADQIEAIFDEFTQVEGGFTRSHEGTGLGLPLARQLVELMGGTLRIESAVGRGTTARVQLPAAV